MNRFARDDSDQPLFKAGIFAICDSLHGSHTGASDPIDDEEEGRMVGYLRHRLEHWYDGMMSDYDKAVCDLIRATLAERG